MPRWAVGLLFLVVGTLAVNQLASTAALLIGLYDGRVSNEEVFKIIGPQSSTITGGFIGIASGFKIGQWAERRARERAKKPPATK